MTSTEAFASALDQVYDLVEPRTPSLDALRDDVIRAAKVYADATTRARDCGNPSPRAILEATRALQDAEDGAHR